MIDPNGPRCLRCLIPVGPDAPPADRFKLVGKLCVGCHADLTGANPPPGLRGPVADRVDWDRKVNR